VVRVVSAPENREIVQTAVPAAVYVPWDDDEAVAEAVRSSSAVGIGPGLGTAQGRRELVVSCLAAVDGAVCVLDADALNIWGDDVDGLARAVPPDTALTPHPGEMGRLLGRDTGDVTGDPLTTAAELAGRTDAVVVLKGTPTVVADPGGAFRISSLVSSGFAAGGMGDVLTGLIAAHAGAGLTAGDAATTALMISGLATVASPAPVGHSAEDVPDRLQAVRAALDTVDPGGIPGVLATLPAARGGGS
jgi:NAD(P)H-hydrate epimerase